MVVVWSANHFYYNGELFSCLLYFSLEAIFCPPVKPGVAFGPTKSTPAAIWLPGIIIAGILLTSASDKIGNSHTAGQSKESADPSA